jgi:hypothetical protein
MLPAEQGARIDVALGWGDRSEVNLTGAYAVDDSVVVDLLVPASARGHLRVILAASSDHYFDLVPTQFQPESDMASLGQVTGDVRRIRVLYNDEEYVREPRLMHATIDADPGKIALLALLSDRPLSSTVASGGAPLQDFAADLGRALESGSARVLSSMTRLIDSR